VHFKSIYSILISDNVILEVSDMDAKLLASIEGKKKELDTFRPLPVALVRRLDEEFSLEWTFNSNAIEGNTLTLKETELVVNRGITVGGKSLREHFEAINHLKAVEDLYVYCRKKADLTKDYILKLHRMILKNIDDENAGSFRRHNVRIAGAYNLPPDARKISRLMNGFIKWYYENMHKLPIADLAAKVHYKLTYIHPFLDGNGRTARLLMNLVLIRNGYPPAVILNLDRKKYYRVLKEADMGNMNGFNNFIGKSIERSLVICLNSIIPFRKKRKLNQSYVSLKEATKYCSYSQEYLSFIARTGKLSAVKFGRNWMTTKEAVREYVRDHGK
jgi:Fic family protein